MNRREMFDTLGIPGDVKEWLTRRLAPREIRKALMDCVATKPRSGEPATWWQKQAESFAEFLESLEGRDEVWEFRSPPDTWEKLGGRGGMCILRDRDIVSIYVTMLS